MGLKVFVLTSAFFLSSSSFSAQGSPPMLSAQEPVCCIGDEPRICWPCVGSPCIEQASRLNVCTKGVLNVDKLVTPLPFVDQSRCATMKVCHVLLLPDNIIQEMSPGHGKQPKQGKQAQHCGQHDELFPALHRENHPGGHVYNRTIHHQQAKLE
jgi:hypothetical protein